MMYYRSAFNKLFLFVCCMIIFSFVACHVTVTTEKNHPARTDSIAEKANSLLFSGQVRRSRIYLDSAYRAFANPGPLDLWQKYSLLNNLYLNYQLDTSKARRYTDSIFLILKGREKIHAAAYAHSLFAMGDLLMAEKHYTEAFRDYDNGHSFAQKNLDSCSLAPFTNQLALIRYRQGRFREAIPYLHRAIEENGHCTADASFNDRLFLPQDILNTIALCYEQLGKLDSSACYYQKDLAFISRQEPLFREKKAFITMLRGVIDGNLGGTYQWLNKLDDARYYLKESIRINDRPGYNINDALSAKFKLVLVDERLADFKEAKELINQIDGRLKVMETDNWEKKISRMNLYDIKWKYFEKAGQLDSAYYFVQKFRVFRDSLWAVEHDMQEADMNSAFKNAEQQYKLNLLAQDNRLKTFYLLATVAFWIMAIVILAVVWYNLNRTRRSNKQIREQNQQIIEQNVKISAQNTQLQNALSSLEQSQDDNTRMMRIVAHDLRNPIGSITSAAALMLDDPGRSADDITMLQLIRASGQNSLDLVSDLLQVNTHTGQLKKEPVDLYNLLHYCVDLLQYKASAKSQHIMLQAAHVTIAVNNEKLWRVVSNLITNAIKFSPVGYVISVSLAEGPSHVTIAVEDHGVGIPASMAKSIFDMSAGAKRIGTAGEESYGMGLAICKQIVEAHNGRIWFESQPGIGTTFYVELPVM
jgi:signal transduction histidine kinase